MLQAALASGTAAPALGLRAVPAPAPGGPAVRRRRRRRARARRDRGASASTTPSSTCAASGVVDEPTLRLAGRLPLRRRRLGLRRGRGLLPLLAAAGRRGRPSPRRCCSRRVLLSIYNHDSAIASAASRMTLAAGDRPCIEMGSRRTHEEAAVAAARAAYVAGFATTSNLAARQRYGVPDGRHQRPHASRCCTTPSATRSAPRSTSLGAGTTLLVDTYDVAEAVRLGGRDRRHRARRGPARLRRPRRARPRGARPARRARRDRHPDRRDQRPRRVRDRRARGRAGRRLRRRHPAGHRQRATRPAASSTSWWPARTTTARWCRWPRRARTRSRSAGASTPCAGVGPHGVAEAEVIGIGAAAATTTATTGRCWCRWCATARSSAASRSTTPATATAPSRAELPARWPADVRAASRSSRRCTWAA